MGNYKYFHTQSGREFIYVLTGLSIMLTVIVLIIPFKAQTVFWDREITFFILVIIFLFLGRIFNSLTVYIDSSNTLGIYFGSGYFRKIINLNEISSTEIIRYPWYYGYGIRLTPYGMMYSVGGKMALKIKYKNGKTFIIGTDDPDNLKKATENG